MKHTPTPWKAGNNDVEIYQAALVFDGAGSGLADCRQYTVSRSREECEANAAFIVKACNNNYALLLEAKRAAAYLLCDRDDVESKTLQRLIEAITPCDKKAGERLLELRDSAIRKLRALQSGNEDTP